MLNNYCMLSVNQHWDPLKICIVGRAHDVASTKLIEDRTIRSVMERIALESEEDYQKLIILLESFGVEVLRPNFVNNGKKPPVAPRDYTAMVGNKFYMDLVGREEEFADICDFVINQGNEIIYDQGINTACLYRLGKDLLFSDIDVFEEAKKDLAYKGLVLSQEQESKLIEMLVTTKGDRFVSEFRNKIKSMFPEYRITMLDEYGHIDGYVCPIKPGLVIAADYIRPEHKDLFSGWEIVPINKFDNNADPELLKFRNTGIGDWWVPDRGITPKFVDYVETYLKHWVGFMSETYFNVNTLIIDESNVVCINFPDHLLKTYEACGIKPHAINFRHRYFWDGGIHCVTSDLHREGQLVDHNIFTSSLQSVRRD